MKRNSSMWPDDSRDLVFYSCFLFTMTNTDNDKESFTADTYIRFQMVCTSVKNSSSTAHIIYHFWCLQKPVDQHTISSSGKKKIIRRDKDNDIVYQLVASAHTSDSHLDGWSVMLIRKLKG